MLEMCSCNLTLDIWSTRCMHAYLGISVHFITDDWRLLTYSPACSKLSGSHTADNILSEYESITMKYNLTSKVFKVVTDNTSNMCAAFEAGVCRPGFEEIDDDDEFLDIDADSQSHTSDDEFSIQQLDEVLKDILVGPEGLACVAHTLQLCIKDGLKPAAALLSTIQKAAKLVNHMSFKTAFSRPVRSRFSRITTSLRSTSKSLLTILTWLFQRVSFPLTRVFPKRVSIFSVAKVDFLTW